MTYCWALIEAHFRTRNTSDAARVVQSGYTKEHSEATQALLKGFVGDIVEGVASSRGLSETEVALQFNCGRDSLSARVVASAFGKCSYPLLVLLLHHDRACQPPILVSNIVGGIAFGRAFAGLR